MSERDEYVRHRTRFGGRRGPVRSLDSFADEYDVPDPMSPRDVSAARTLVLIAGTSLSDLAETPNQRWRPRMAE
jgi:hypothetical protein